MGDDAQHPNAIPLVLTRRTVWASSYMVADRLIAALGRSGVGDADLLASFRGVLGLVMGSAQAELPAAGRNRTGKGAGGRRGADRRSGRRRASAHRRVGASQPTVHTAADFERALDILLAGIESFERRRDRR
ncbi:tetracyclin repressor, C-terminal all-alpha domain protein [Mycobacterium ulcerans str. Harvey]|uniref:Tetracyclin repressor, C-terminal all-alpha domain protein n=1 Tax=Mycobacterium ulcerans str. Harvey TaxID=1299332 RepID=A0ABP3ABL9_MYCUL|nr:tetracyclin repressor, C-terminal all-alpha domain protein [Mycobacterium ulcerans str. Harvey]